MRSLLAFFLNFSHFFWMAFGITICIKGGCQLKQAICPERWICCLTECEKSIIVYT